MFDKYYSFYQHSQLFQDPMQKGIESFDVLLQCIILEFIASLKNNGTKCFLFFDDSCEEIGNSKTFVDNATTGGDRELSNVHIRLILFLQSMLRWNFELQKTRIVLLRFSREVMQMDTLSAHLGLGRELVDRYRDATSVP